MNRAEISDQLRSEVERLHDFISSWVRGEAEPSAALFEAGFSRYLSDDFVNIQPAGAQLSKAVLVDEIFRQHGANPAFQIAINSFELISVSAGTDIAVARYVEDQSGARNSIPSENSRISTVVFEFSEKDGLPIWRYLQETGLTKGK